MVTKVALPTRPDLTPRKGTLLDAAVVTDQFAWLDGVEAFWDSYSGITFQQGATFCPPTDETKDLSQTAAWTGGWRFAVYGGVTCKAIGLDMADQKEQVGKMFALGESTGVERALMETRFVDDSEVVDGDPLDRWDAATDITPAGGAVSAKAAVGLLQGWMANYYVGTPTLHMPIAVASILLDGNGLEFDGNLLRTKMGSKVAAGAGYDFANTGPTAAAAPAGEKWVYGSGEVFIGRGDLIVRQSLNTENNDVLVLGERGYIAAVDGPTVAVRVKVE